MQLGWAKAYPALYVRITRGWRKDADLPKKPSRMFPFASILIFRKKDIEAKRWKAKEKIMYFSFSFPFPSSVHIGSILSESESAS